MSPAIKRVAARLIRGVLAPALEDRGFSARGKTLYRDAAPLQHVVELQLARWGTEEAGAATLNLGISMPDVYTLVWGHPPSAFTKITDCIVRVRIGALADGGRLLDRQNATDQWWEFDPETDIARLGQEMSYALQARGLPFLDRFDSSEAVLKFLTEHENHTNQLPLERIYAAVIAYQLGYSNKASAFLMEAHNIAGWRERAAETAARLGAELK